MEIAEAARTAIETSHASPDWIAMTTRFGAPGRMRRTFLRGFGLPPQALRRQAKL